jgi:hypothetical protein
LPDNQAGLPHGQLSFAMNTAVGILTLIGILYAAVWTVLLMQLPLEPLTISILLGLYLFAYYLWVRKSAPMQWRLRLTALLVAVLLLVGSVYVNSGIHDASFDGQGYHQLAIGTIADGWNPLYDFDTTVSVWVRHYPKAVWLLGAAFYTWTGSIDTGKSLNLALLLASSLAAYAVLVRCIGPRRGAWLLAGLTAACAAFNPVSVVQLFTHYNDGLIGSLLLTLLCTFVYYAQTKERSVLAAAAVCIVLLLNIKFTAVAYAALLCGFFLVYLLLFDQGKRWKKITLFLAVVGVASIVIVGFNPYVYNTAKQGHPLYPLMGADKVDIMTLNSPGDFAGKSRLEKFHVSYTAKTEDPISPWASRPAALWPVSWEEYEQMEVDTRTAGFGPLTLWLYITAPVLWLLILIFDWRRGAAGGALAAALMITVAINPEAWWARYVPQLWLVPLVLVAVSLTSRRWLLHAAALLVLAIALTNAGGAAGVSLGRQLAKSERIEAQYKELQALQHTTLAVYPNGFSSMLYRLKEYDISYRRGTEEELCEASYRFLYTQGAYCIEKMEEK